MVADTAFANVEFGKRSVVHDCLPDGWDQLWAATAPSIRKQVKSLRRGAEKLSRGIPLLDRTFELSSLVGSTELRRYPVHRWYFYKEGFSPQLPRLIVRELGIGATGRVVDSFAGVATTPLSLNELELAEVIGVEYSPFAHFIGQVKMSASILDATRLRQAIGIIERLIADEKHDIEAPTLSTFHNSEIFDPAKLAILLRAREAVIGVPGLTEPERDFFRLGIAAVIEDVSGAMKDGRALRVLRGRKRKPNSLTPKEGIRAPATVVDVLVNQWLAMVEDVRFTQLDAGLANWKLFKGDARQIEEVLRHNLGVSSVEDSVGLHFYSPPYLNCLDYTEVYKLELWLLEFVTSQAEFRSLREGTLRSHPSIKFPDRTDPGWGQHGVFALIDELTAFLEDQLPQRAVGTMVGQYFRDMYESLCGQVLTLEPGGHIACVVANSTFSGRQQNQETRIETWRLPILTDLFIARLAECAGAVPIAIWNARALRPRNSQGGTARESVVICRKASNGR